MELVGLQRDLAAGIIRLDVSNHARIEALKDGLTPADLQHAALFGEAVEEYPDRDRVLVLGIAPGTGIPCHLALEYQNGDQYATIVTAYVPDATIWQRDYKTRK